MTSAGRRISRKVSGVAMLVLGMLAAGNILAQSKNGHAAMADQQITEKQMTGTFKGAKVNGGMTAHVHKDGRHVLTWSDDFTIPDTPAPHWQVVDSKGNVYLLQRLKIKDDKLNRTITVPDYVQDIAKVQIWCAWAEALLGEAAFEQPVN